MDRLPVLLSIAGFDPSGGAGLQADIETAGALGIPIVCAQTCQTIQDSKSASLYTANDSTLLARQIETILADFMVAGIKIGLLPTVLSIQVVANTLRQVLRQVSIPIVLDPVLRDGSGQSLTDMGCAQALRQHLIPLAQVITPNREELLALVPHKPLDYAAQQLLEEGCLAVLVTSAKMNSKQLQHYLYQSGQEQQTFVAQKRPYEYHGSGCTLSTAIAVGLAQGQTINTAVSSAQNYTMQTLDRAQRLGGGRHFPKRL